MEDINKLGKKDIDWLYANKCGWAAQRIIQQEKEIETKQKMLEDCMRQRNEAIARAAGRAIGASSDACGANATEPAANGSPDVKARRAPKEAKP